MASLIGKADPSLVTAAARAGLANVPGDYSKQFGIMADANKDLLTGVATAFKQYETDKKASKKELEDAMKDLRTYGVGIENNADYNMFSDEMDAQVAIWKENGGFQNDSKGLREWERQNNKIMGKYKSNQTSLIEAIEKFEASDSWIDGLEPGDSKFLTSLTKYAKNVDDKSGTHNAKANDYMANNTGADTDKTPEQLWKHLVVLGAKEGEMVKYLDPATNEFSYITSINGKVVSKKSSEISEMIPTKAITTETTIQGRLNDIAKNPTGTYTANDSLMNQNWLERVIDQAVENGESLQYLMNQKYGGMKESFADSLRNGTAAITPAIIQSLSDLGYTIEDQAKGEKGHGVLDKNDFMIGTNYNTIVDEILNGEDTYELRRDLFIDKLDNEVFRHEAEQGSGRTKVDFFKKKIQKLDGSDWNGSSAESVYKDILAGTTFTEKDPDTKKINVYSYHDGSWYQNWKQGDTPKTKESYIGSADDLGRIFTNDSRFRNIKTAAAKQQGETPKIETENEVVNGVEIKVPKKKEGIVSNKPKPRTPSTASVIKASDLEGITKEKSKAGITIYYNYEGNDIDAAKKALSQAKGTTGIDDPFISYWIGDKGIDIREYENLKDKSNVTFKVQIGVDKTPPPLQDLKVKGQEPLSEPVVPSDTTITEPPAIEDVDQDYGPDNPDPMAGKINNAGDMILNESGEYIPLDSNEGKKIAKNYLGMQDEVKISGAEEMNPELKKGETPIIKNTLKKVVEEVVKENPVLKENIENPNATTNALEYIVNNGYLNVNEAEADSPLVKSIEGVYKELLGTRKDSLAVTKSLTHDDKAWCGAFVYDVLTKTGAMETGDRVQSEEAYNKLRAAKYLNVGTPVDLDTEDPKMGDIIVVSRMVKGKKQYHVAFYSGKDKNGKVIMLGGNQDDQVSFKTVTDNYTIEGYRRMENMSDIKEATAAGYKAKYGVKGGEGKLI